MEGEEMSGSEGNKKLVRRMALAFRTDDMLVPGMAQNFAQQALLKCLEGRVNAFASEMESGGGRKFLEIIQTNDYLEIWFMGKKYKLTPIDD